MPTRTTLDSYDLECVRGPAGAILWWKRARVAKPPVRPRSAAAQLAAQLVSIMETIDGLTDIDLIKATSLTNIITAGPWNHGQKLRLSARLTARYSVVILQQTSKPQQQCMTYEDYLTALDWEEVDGATGMQVKIRVVASRAVTLDLINPNEN